MVWGGGVVSGPGSYFWVNVHDEHDEHGGPVGVWRWFGGWWEVEKGDQMERKREKG